MKQGTLEVTEKDVSAMAELVHRLRPTNYAEWPEYQDLLDLHRRLYRAVHIAGVDKPSGGC